MPRIAPLFDQIPPLLFVPLASPLKRVYWDVLTIAYRLHQAADQCEVAKEALLDRVEERFQDQSTEAAESPEVEDDEPADLSEPRLFAWRALRQLERCGWFEYEYRRDHGAVLRIPDYACRLLATLEETARGERPHVAGLAYNVQQILTDDELHQTDPGFVLYQAKKAVAVFLRELKVLRSNMGRYVERAAEREQVRDLLALQMDDFWPKVVEPSYQRFKTSDNVLKFRMEILDRLEALANDPLFVQEAAARVESQEQLDPEEAKAQVHDWLDRIRVEIQSLDELIEEIDARHAHYVGLTLQRIRHRLHRNETTETRLVELIARLESLPPEAEDVWTDLLEAYHLQTLGEDSLYRVPGPAMPHVPEPLSAETISEEDRLSLLAQARESLAGELSREAVFEEIRQLMEIHPTVQLADLPLANDHEFLRLIALHAYRHEPSAPYELRMAEDHSLVRSGAYLFRNGRLTRKRMEDSG